MRKKYLAITLAIGILSASISMPVLAQNKSEAVLSDKVALMESNVNEAKQSIAAYIQEDMQKYDTGASATRASNSSVSVINPEKISFKQYIQQKKRLNQNRQNAFGFEVEEKNAEITYGDISYENGVYTIDYVVDETLQFAHLDSPTYVSTKHTAIVEPTEDGFVINDDTSDDPIDLYVRDQVPMEEYIASDQREIQQELQAETKVLSEKEQASLQDISTRATTSSFNRTAMYNYAYNNYNKRPSQWGNFDGMGGDCTNFVSQIIYAGGAPFDTTGSYTWYYKGMSNRAPSWTSVSSLHNYLVNNDYIGPQGKVDSSNAAYIAAIGDVIQIDFGMDGTYDHSTSIVHHQTSITSQTTVAAHTNDRWNYPISNYSGTKRWIHLTGYMK